MKLVIISGRSGSGKSTALHLLEDEGYYCIDNLPVALIPALISHLKGSSSKEHDKVALCIDARNANPEMSSLIKLLKDNTASLNIEIIFLDADEEILIKRFSETRRKHPLSNQDTALGEAIQSEKELLQPVIDNATLVVDTSELTLHELRATIKSRLVDKKGPGISILFQSFGFKRGIPIDADIVYDVRVLPNPHWDTSLRALCGLDQPVIQFLDKQPEVNDMLNDIETYLEKWLPSFEENNRSYITIGIGCTGGQHRSVYLAEKLASYFRGSYVNVQVRHREMRMQEKLL